MKNKKRLIWIALIIVTVLVVLAVVKSNKSDRFKVTVADVSSQTILETVIANGKIQPETEVVISSEVSGKILELPFKEGAEVKEGDLLVRINPDLAQAALDRAQAGLTIVPALTKQTPRLDLYRHRLNLEIAK